MMSPLPVWSSAHSSPTTAETNSGCSSGPVLSSIASCDMRVVAMGAMQLTVMPRLRPSSLRVFISPTSAILAAA